MESTEILSKNTKITIIFILGRNVLLKKICKNTYEIVDFGRLAFRNAFQNRHRKISETFPIGKKVFFDSEKETELTLENEIYIIKEDFLVYINCPELYKYNNSINSMMKKIYDKLKLKLDMLLDQSK